MLGVTFGGQAGRRFWERAKPKNPQSRLGQAGWRASEKACSYIIYEIDFYFYPPAQTPPQTCTVSVLLCLSLLCGCATVESFVKRLWSCSCFTVLYQRWGFGLPVPFEWKVLIWLTRFGSEDFGPAAQKDKLPIQCCIWEMVSRAIILPIILEKTRNGFQTTTLLQNSLRPPRIAIGLLLKWRHVKAFPEL